MPLPRPITLQTPGLYPPQQAPPYPPHPVRPTGPAARPQGQSHSGHMCTPCPAPASALPYHCPALICALFCPCLCSDVRESSTVSCFSSADVQCAELSPSRYMQDWVTKQGRIRLTTWCRATGQRIQPGTCCWVRCACPPQAGPGGVGGSRNPSHQGRPKRRQGGKQQRRWVCTSLCMQLCNASAAPPGVHSNELYHVDALQRHPFLPIQACSVNDDPILAAMHVVRLPAQR